jgi:hypothetical protein
VQQRSKQIGIRRALGATRGQILRYFQTENFLLATLGIVLGMLAAYAINLALMNLYELPRMPLHYLPLGALLLWVLGQIAVFGPARARQRYRLRSPRGAHEMRIRWMLMMLLRHCRHWPAVAARRHWSGARRCAPGIALDRRPGAAWRPPARKPASACAAAIASCAWMTPRYAGSNTLPRPCGVQAPPGPISCCSATGRN